MKIYYVWVAKHCDVGYIWVLQSLLHCSEFSRIYKTVINDVTYHSSQINSSILITFQKLPWCVAVANGRSLTAIKKTNLKTTWYKKLIKIESVSGNRTSGRISAVEMYYLEFIKKTDKMLSLHLHQTDNREGSLLICEVIWALRFGFHLIPSLSFERSYNHNSK